MCIRDSHYWAEANSDVPDVALRNVVTPGAEALADAVLPGCLLYTSDAADERSSVDLGGRRIIKKKNRADNTRSR